MSFSWQKLPKPIFGLAPMDGVTDSVTRSIVYRHGPPDVLFTEFVSAEGLSRRIPALFNDLKYETHERPMIAQIYGYEPEAFRACVPLIAELGFDGLDINMGCPAKSVVHGGGGAALIKTCPQAKKIIGACAEELDRWFEKTGKRLPLSVKTRLGYDKVVVKDWVRELLDTDKLSNISLHGRTLKQGYSGSADWDAIAEAVGVAQGNSATILGNGDLQSFSEAMEKIKKTGVDGALFGRATFGRPWFFRNKEKFRNGEEHRDLPVPPEERFSALLEHGRLLSERKDPWHFIQIRKHAGWYMKGFEGASELRARLMQVRDFAELELMLREFVDSRLRFTGPRGDREELPPRSEEIRLDL